MQHAAKQPGTAATLADGNYQGPVQDGLRHGVGVLKFWVRPAATAHAHDKRLYTRTR